MAQLLGNILLKLYVGCFVFTFVTSSGHPQLPPTCGEEMMMNMENCTEIVEKECGVCHDMYMKECSIHMHVSYVPVKVEECRLIPDCVLGEKKCFTKYRKECTTEMKYEEKEEKHPKCGVQIVQKCTNSSLNSLEEDDCHEIPVMKCTIEKKMMKKEVPQDVCRSVPEEMCNPENCLKCFNRVSLKRKMEPKEDCQYKKKRYCQTANDGSDECRDVKSVKCETVSHLMVQKLCSSEDFEWRVQQMP